MFRRFRDASEIGQTIAHSRVPRRLGSVRDFGRDVRRDRRQPEVDLRLERWRHSWKSIQQTSRRSSKVEVDDVLRGEEHLLWTSLEVIQVSFTKDYLELSLFECHLKDLSRASRKALRWTKCYHFYECCKVFKSYCIGFRFLLYLLYSIFIFYIIFWSEAPSQLE